MIGMMRKLLPGERAALWYAIADAAALIVFVLVGISGHRADESHGDGHAVRPIIGAL